MRKGKPFGSRGKIDYFTPSKDFDNRREERVDKSSLILVTGKNRCAQYLKQIVERRIERALLEFGIDPRSR